MTIVKKLTARERITLAQFVMNDNQSKMVA